MERKIGEIFEYNGEWYQCVRGDICADCAFAKKHCNEKPLFEAIGSCSKYYRKDATSVIFKKLEKVGEPFIGKVHIQLQRYKKYTEPIIDPAENFGYVNEKNTIAIEVKQNKEDMEEKKLNIKPFDINSAKQGKTVCTRDGRKARIICFDRKDNTPIVALIERVDGIEILQCYHNDGKCFHYETSNNDLMMLPEKKEGWVNVYKECDGEYYVEKVVYKIKGHAVENSSSQNYVGTVRIEFYE